MPLGPGSSPLTLVFGTSGAGTAVGIGAAASTLFVMVAEQTVRVPPPFDEPLHWSMMKARPEDCVPLAVQVNEAPPPFPEPLHWVIVALVVVAGSGLQARTVPVVAEPTHWLTVAAVTVGAGVIPMKLLVTTTLHRSVPPPPLMEPSH